MSAKQAKAMRKLETVFIETAKKLGDDHTLITAKKIKKIIKKNK